jgi:hypothetical protein
MMMFRKIRHNEDLNEDWHRCTYRRRYRWRYRRRYRRRYRWCLRRYYWLTRFAQRIP